MISGMRVRRRSSAGGGSAYKFYQLVVLTPGQGTFFYLAQLGLVHSGAPDGIPTGGTISASESPVNNPASNAFNDDPFTSWGGTPTPAWLRYEFPTPVALDAYFLRVLTGPNGDYYGPRSWRLEASNDAVTWDVLHAETVAGWEGGQVRTYPL